MYNNSIQILCANWNAPSNIKTLITTAHADFNLALHVNDDPVKVQSNRQYLANYVPNNPLWLNQTHSTNVINWDNESNYTIYDADASFTTQKKQVCVIMTADCLPILLTNKTGDFVAAIHAGWRGLNNGIIQKTFKEIRQHDFQDIIAFIGPAINQECFEIGGEVKQAFIDNNQRTAEFFSDSINNGKYLANLRKIAELILLQQGVEIKNVYNSSICTKCTTNWFYSFRDNPHSGRFATIIWIE